MATGYTECIKKGIDFKTFVLRCSRAFGPCVMKPSKYYTNKVKKTKQELDNLKKMTHEDAERACVREYNEYNKRYEENVREKSELKEKYEVMLSEVRKWQPPSKDYNGLKKFMIEQINQSIKWDCSPPDPIEPKKSGKEWLKSRIKSCKYDLKYYSKEEKQENNNYEFRKKWIEKLMKI